MLDGSVCCVNYAAAGTETATASQPPVTAASPASTSQPQQRLESNATDASPPLSSATAAVSSLADEQSNAAVDVDGQVSSSVAQPPEGLGSEMVEGLGSEMVEGLRSEMVEGLGSEMVEGLGSEMVEGLGSEMVEGLGSEMVEGLGAVMAEHVRRKTGLSHAKSQLAVSTVLSVLAERVPATQNLVAAIQHDFSHQHVC